MSRPKNRVTFVNNQLECERSTRMRTVNWNTNGQARVRTVKPAAKSQTNRDTSNVASLGGLGSAPGCDEEALSCQ